MKAGRLCLIIGLLLVAFKSHGEVLTGRVIDVSDGDTVKFLDEQQRTLTLRLAGVDAPEIRQEFGQKARSVLVEVCLDKPAKAEVRTIDRYGRTVARVSCTGVDVAFKLLHEGLAWHFTRYARSQPSDEATADRIAQDDAKAGGRGLWGQPDPIAPWDWRLAQKVPVKLNQCSGSGRPCLE